LYGDFPFKAMSDMREILFTRTIVFLSINKIRLNSRKVYKFYYTLIVYLIKQYTLHIMNTGPVITMTSEGFNYYKSQAEFIEHCQELDFSPSMRTELSTSFSNYKQSNNGNSNTNMSQVYVRGTLCP
jgi:hypothetical protein